MTSLESHLRKIREHLEAIRDCIDRGIENKPVTLGFHCSACSVEILELYLHKINKVPISKVLKHNWFKQPTLEQKKEPLADRKVGAQFPEKAKIFDLLYQIESLRDTLIYGNPTPQDIEKVIVSFQNLKSILITKLKMEGIDLEKE